jgi:membrane fusion protein (multidrug efflux system)
LADVAFGSQQRLEQATADHARAAAALAAALAAKTAAVAALAGAKDAAEVLKAERSEAEHARSELVTAQAKAERDLSFTEIRAPFDGVVGNKAAVVGQYALPGTRLLAVVPVQAAYVDANFKETQLDAIRPGQKVDIAVDSFDGRVVPGVVESVSPASGARFSLLPPDNATGNFTKVVQRVTVRIAIAPETLAREPLRAGLSVVATIHTRDESQPRPTLLGLFGLGAAATETSAAK